MKKTMFVLILTSILLVAIVPVVFAESETPECAGCFGDVMSDKAQRKDFTITVDGNSLNYLNMGQRMKDIAQGENLSVSNPERNVKPGASDWIADVKFVRCSDCGE